MAYVSRLRCAKCGRTYQPRDRVLTCKQDQGRLQVEYDYDSLAHKLSRDTLEPRQEGLWQYCELLPKDRSAENVRRICCQSQRSGDWSGSNRDNVEDGFQAVRLVSVPEYGAIQSVSSRGAKDHVIRDR